MTTSEENSLNTLAAVAASSMITRVNDLDDTVTAVRSIYIGDNPQPTVTIDTFLQNFAVDSVSELLVPQWLSGHVTNVEQGNDVQITLGDKQYRARVDSNGEWSLPLAAADLAALTTGSHTLTVTVTNNSGNSAQASQQVARGEIALDSAESYIAINPLTGDDVLIAQEKAAPQTISGVTQGVAAGSVVTVTLGGKVYQASVNDNGDWSVKLPVQDVRALADGEQTVTATVAGSSEAVSDNRTLLVEHGQGDQWAATIQFAAGNPRSVFDFDRDEGLTFSGSTYSVADGKEVWVQLGEHIYSATVFRNQWQVTIKGEDLQQLDHGWTAVRVWVKDLHETASAETSIYFSPDPLPAVSFDSAYQKVTFDSYGDLQTPLVLQGNTSYYRAGSYVDITIAGKHYQAQVDSIGEWVLVLSPAELATLPLGTTTVTASVSNELGQRQSTATFSRDSIAEPSGREIYINTVAGDDRMTGRERDATHVVSGSTHGFAAGEILQITVLQDVKGYATVDANGVWSFSFNGADVKDVSDTRYNRYITVSSVSSEEHPDIVKATHTFINDYDFDDKWSQYLAKITIDPVTGDDLLSSAEQQQNLTVSGTVDNVADGKPVWVQLGTHVYATTVQDGKWHTEISADDLAQLNSGSATLLASVKDLSETASASRNFELAAQSAPQQQSVEIAENDTTDQNALASLTLASLGLSEAPQLTDTAAGVSNDTSSNENITLSEAPADLWDAAVTASSVAITHDYPVTPLISLAELLEPQTL